jgi:hypothetical protein
MRNLKKLLNLKPWLTLSDAARHLGILFDDDVSEADVLRFGLDRYLTLSVNFVNHAYGRPGRLVPISEAKRTSVPSLDTGEVIQFFDGYLMDDDNVIEWEDKIISLAGVWDLAMVSAETIDVERQYQQLTDGPPVDLCCWDGPIVCIGDGLYCEVRVRFSDEEIARFSSKEEKSSSTSKSLNNKTNALERFLNPRNYFPAGALPNDSVLVVRTSALKELEALVSQQEQRPEKPIERRERMSLLVIIAALAKMAKIDVTKPSAAAIAIETQTELMGTRVASRTIENHLNRIPEALENRGGK